jgi:hypothetical protein
MSRRLSAYDTDRLGLRALGTDNAAVTVRSL